MKDYKLKLRNLLVSHTLKNKLGRVFRSDQTGDFSCYTYPVYKPIDTKLFRGANAPLTFVPTHSPNYKSSQLCLCLSHTVLVVLLEHLKRKTRLTIEKFASVKGECEI